MKEIFSLLSSKTSSLVGKKPAKLQDPGSGSRVAQARLAFFVEAFNSISADTDLKAYTKDLESLRLPDRVVAYEGAYSAAICLDISNPREISRASELTELAPSHVAGLGLGAGHALSNLGVSAEVTDSFADHFLGVMAMDAYGMHEGYFHWYERVQSMRAPVNLPPLAMAAFDQGLGRGIWFICNGDAKAVRQILERFPLERRSDLWRGVGLMVGFWGADDEATLKGFLKCPREFMPYMQSGAAQGVSMRTDMDDVLDYTKASAEVICGANAEELAEMATSSMMKHTSDVFDTRAYFGWQNEMVKFFAEQHAK